MRLVELYRPRKLKLRELVGRTYSLEQINEALARWRARGREGLIRFQPEQ